MRGCGQVPLFKWIILVPFWILLKHLTLQGSINPKWVAFHLKNNFRSFSHDCFFFSPLVAIEVQKPPSTFYYQIFSMDFKFLNIMYCPLLQCSSFKEKLEGIDFILLVISYSYDKPSDFHQFNIIHLNLMIYNQLWRKKKHANSWFLTIHMHAKKSNLTNCMSTPTPSHTM